MRVDRWVTETDGALSEKALARKLEAMGYRVSRYVYPPGTFFGVHRHDVDKVDAVFSGRFRVTMGEESVELGPGDAVHVPRGTSHSAEVIGKEPVVSFDAERIPGE